MAYFLYLIILLPLKIKLETKAKARDANRKMDHFYQEKDVEFGTRNVVTFHLCNV